MSEIIFTDKSVKPGDRMLAEVLGPTFKLWQEIKESLEKKYGKLKEEWKYYGQKNGWTLKMLHGKRNLFFFKPYDKYFIIAYAFGEKAVSEIVESDLPDKVIDEIKNARKYAEGRGLRIDVKEKSDAKVVLKLTGIKAAN